MELWRILLLLLVHTVADFVLQTDRVAQGKSTSNVILWEHVAVYTCSFVPAMLVMGGNFQQSYAWLVLNFLAHFATDFVSSRLTSHLWKKGSRHNFFVTIGFDQLAHATALLATYQWLLT